MLLCLMSICSLTSCVRKSNWGKKTDQCIRCFSNETNRTDILVCVSSSTPNAECCAINVGDYCEPLPTIIKLEVSFEDGESHTFNAIYYDYYDYFGDSVDGFFGTAEETGGLNIIIENSELESILRCHDVCRITSQAFKQPYTFQTKGLSKAIIRTYHHNHRKKN